MVAQGQSKGRGGVINLSVRGRELWTGMQSTREICCVKCISLFIILCFLLLCFQHDVVVELLLVRA